MDTTTIVYGPMRCGKTYNSKKLAKKFGCSSITDDWDGQTRLPANTLALTWLTPPYRNSQGRAVAYETINLAI